MCTVAFLDVDHTLLFDSPDSLNLTLLNALLDNGITRVFLFTDMTFSQHAIEERNGLMKQLEELGFSVHGAITPNDVTWAMMDVSEVRKLHEMCFQDRSYTGKLYGSDFESFIQGRVDVLPNLSNAIGTYQPLSSPPGEAYSDACLELHANSSISDETKMKSIFAKVFADHLSEKHGFKHNKGLLLDHFLHHKPDWIDGIIVFDDNANVIADLTNFKRVDLSNIDTTTNSSTAAADQSKTVISAVPVTSSTLPSEYYIKLIKAHLQKCL